MFARLLLLPILTLGFIAHAGALLDVNEDIEDLTNESDAAVAESEEVKQRLAKDRARAERVYQEANKSYKAAVSKRQQAVDQLKKSENDIEFFLAERTRLLAEADRLTKEGAMASKATQDNLAKIEKSKQDVETLTQLRAEKASRFLELSGERDKVTSQLKDIEQQQAQAEAEFQKSKEAEKLANAEFEKVKQEELRKKAKLDAYLAGLKERHRQAQERMAAIEGEKQLMQRNAAKLEAQARAGEAEVQDAEAAALGKRLLPTRVLSSTEEEMTFKRTCRFFDGPTKGSKVLGTKSSGSSINKKDEGKTWVAFSLDDGRKAFAAKKCFQILQSALER